MNLPDSPFRSIFNVLATFLFSFLLFSCPACREDVVVLDQARLESMAEEAYQLAVNAASGIRTAGDFESANQLLAQLGSGSLSEEDDYAIEIRQYVGLFYEAIGQYYLAIRTYEKGLEGLTDPSLLKAISFQHPLARSYTREGDSEKAGILLLQAKGMVLEAYDTISNFEEKLNAFYALGDIFLEMGNAYLDQQDYQAALKTYEEGLAWLDKEVDAFAQWLAASDDIDSEEFIEEFELENENSRARFLINKALALHHLEETPKGVSLLRSLELEQLYTENVIGALENMGSLLPAIGEEEEGEQKLLEALQLAQQYYEERAYRREVGKIHLSLGDFYLEQKQFDQALTQYQHALKEAIPRFQPPANDDLQNPNTDFLYTENVIIDGLLGKAETLWQGYLEGQRTTEDLKSAQEALERMIETEELLLTSYSFASAQLQLLEESVPRRELLIKIFYELQEKTDFRQAELWFKYFEKSKASLYRRQVNLKNIIDREKSDIPDAVLFEYLSLRDDLEDVTAELAGLYDDEDTQWEELKEEKLDLINKIEVSIRLMETFDPAIEFYRQDDLITYPDLQEKLPAKSAVALYFSGYEHIYLLGIYPDRPPVFQRIKKEEKRLQAFLELFSNPNRNKADKDLGIFRQFVAESRYFYEQLLEPVFNQADLEQLIVLPDSQLFYLPFEALLSRDFSQAGIDYDVLARAYAELPYVFRDKSCAVRYAHTTSQLWKDRPSDTDSKAGKTFLGIQPNYDCCKSGLSRILDGTRKKMSKIADKWQGNTLYDKTNNANFLDLATQSNIVLFHGHFIAEGLPYLALSCPANSCEDVRLYTYDLKSASFDTDLFFAAGCQSSIGSIAPGEGMQNLERILLLSGVKNTVSSLWEVNDEATSEFTSHFFESLLETNDYEAAIGAARMKMLQSPYAPPFYWSAFILSGKLKSGLEP